MALKTMLNKLTPQNLQCRNTIRLMKPKLLDYLRCEKSLPSSPVFNRGGGALKLKPMLNLYPPKNLQK